MTFEDIKKYSLTAAIILLLLSGFLGYRLYNEWQDKKAVQTSLENNKAAWSDRTRKLNDYTTRLMKEYNLSDSVKSAKLSSVEVKIAALFNENARLKNQQGNAIYVTQFVHDTVLFTKGVDTIFRDTLANKLMATTDSIHL